MFEKFFGAELFGIDPPKSPLKRGTSGVKVPLFKGDLGGSNTEILQPQTCMYTVALTTHSTNDLRLL
jgi:hypothetical protein